MSNPNPWGRFATKDTAPANPWSRFATPEEEDAASSTPTAVLAPQAAEAEPGAEVSMGERALRGLRRGVGNIIEGAGGYVRSIGDGATAGVEGFASEPVQLRHLGRLGKEPPKRGYLARLLGQDAPTEIGTAKTLGYLERATQGGETTAARNERLGAAITAKGESILNDPRNAKISTKTYDPTSAGWWVEGLSEVAPQLFGQLGLAYATRGRSALSQMVAYAPTAIQEGGSTYNRAYDYLREQGKGEDEARAAATGAGVIAGAVNAGLEKLGLDQLMTKSPAAQRLILTGLAKRLGHVATRVGEGMVSEGVTEALQELVSDVTHRLATEDPEAFADWQSRYPAVAALGAAAGGGVNVVTGGIEATRAPNRQQVAREMTRAAELAQFRRQAAESAHREEVQRTEDLVGAGSIDAERARARILEAEAKLNERMATAEAEHAQTVEAVVPPEPEVALPEAPNPAENYFEAIPQAPETAPQTNAENRNSPDESLEAPTNPAVDPAALEHYMSEPGTGALSPFHIDQLTGGPTGEAEQQLYAAAMERARPAAPKTQSQKRTPPAAAIGAALDVVFPSRRKVRSRWTVVEADDVRSSNDPHTFQRRAEAEYPSRVQGRGYDGDRGRAAREVVESIVPKWDEDMALDPTMMVDAGASLVAPYNGGWITVAGNQRDMLMQRVRQQRPDAFERYRSKLTERAQQFGLDPHEIEGMRAPVLVRAIDDPSVDVSNVETLRELNIDSDADAKKVKDGVSDAAARAERLAQAGGALQHLQETIPADETLRAYLGSTNGSNFVQRLLADGVISANEKARYMDAAGEVTAEGKQLIERMMLAAAVGDADVIARAPDALLRKLDHALPALIRAAQLPDWDIRPVLREALELAGEVRAQPGGMTIADYVNQGDVLGEGGARWQGKEDVTALAELLSSAKPRELVQRFRRYAEEADLLVRGEVPMFGEAPDPVQAFGELLGQRPAVRPMVIGDAKGQPSEGTPNLRNMDSEAGVAMNTSRSEIFDETHPEPFHSSERVVSPSETARTSVPSDLPGGTTTSGSFEVGDIDSSSGRMVYQPSGHLDELLDRAKRLLPEFERVLKRIASTLQASYTAPRVKGLDRLMEKIEGGKPAHTISDYVGGRMQIDPVRMNEALQALNDAGWKVIEDEDFLDRPRLGYRARHLQVLSPEGMSVELQLIPPEIAAAQKEAHKAYERFRAPDATDEVRGEALAESERIFGEAWEKYQARTQGGQSGTRALEVTSPLQRGFITDEQLPDVRPQRMLGGNLDAPRRSQIVGDLSRALKIPIREGKLGRGYRMAQAVYKVMPGVIRAKFLTDIEAVSHEVGHHVHKLLFGTVGGDLSMKGFAPYRAELEPLGVGISAGDLPEGVAEFFRRYLTNEAAARQAAPGFYALIDGRLQQEMPAVHEALLKARADYSRWLEASPAARQLSRISVQEDPTHLSIRDRWERFRANYIDDLAPVARVMRELTAGRKGPLGVQESAEALGRLLSGYTGQAEHFLERGTLDFATLKHRGRPLKEILTPVQEQLDDFRAYLVSRRDIELLTRTDEHGKPRPVETGGTLADARWTVQHMEAENAHFDKAAEQLYLYQDQLLDYLVDAGVVAPDAAKAMREANRNYVPFFRVMEDADDRARPGLGKKVDHLFNPTKRIKGSGRDVVDPLESIIKNTFAYAQLAARQQVSVALADLVDATPGAGRIMERLDAPMRAEQTTIGELEKQLTEAMGDKAFAAAKKSNPKLADELLTIFRPGDYLGQQNVISVLRDGERVWYKVNDHDLYHSLVGMDKEHVDVISRILAFPGRMLRAGATLAPEFMGRNPVRDQVMAFVQSEYGYKPGYDLARGIFHVLKKDDLYWKWKAAGGEHATLVGMDRQTLQKQLRRLAGQKRGVIENVVKTPLELLQALSATMEEGTRLGEFSRATDRVGDSKAGLQTAALASREISTDFARHGAKLTALRAMTAFWNARIQGYDRLFRAYKTDPIGTNLRALAAITLPTVLLHYVNRDDEEYWEIPQWQRDLFWCVKAGSTWVRIPKPFELGMVYGTLVERLLEWKDNEDPGAFRKAVGDFVTGELTSTVAPIPTFAVPLIGNLANYDLFLNRPVTPRYLEGVEAEYQFTDGTSEVAKQLGRWLGYPPTKIDNLLRGYTGGLGRLGSEAVDLGVNAARHAGGEEVPESPSQGFAGLPGVRGFTTATPGASSESVERFYLRYGKAEEAAKTVQTLEREGRMDEVEKYERRPDVQQRLADRPYLARDAEYLAGVRKEMTEIRRDPSLGGREKRRMLDELGKVMQQNAAAAIQRRTRPVPNP